MFQLKKIEGIKLKSHFQKTGNEAQEESPNNSLGSASNVNEEYMKAFRTRSYLEMWSKVEDKIGGISIDRLLSSSSLPLDVHLSQHLLEPQQETLDNMIETHDPHYLLIDYFKATSEACTTCEIILRSIHQTRGNHRRIERVINLAKRVQNEGVDCTNDQCHAIHGELASFTELSNPLSAISPKQFDEIHERYGFLLQRLTSKAKKFRRRSKLVRFCQKAFGLSLIVSYVILMTALLLFAAHSVVGIVAASGVVGLCMCSKRVNKVVLHRHQGLWRRGLIQRRLGSQLDVAARGIYILIKDFDTMSRLVSRLQDEAEHYKSVAGICVMNGASTQVLREVVKEFNTHETSFLEQLEELEEHIHLCFLTINRSRRLVLQEIMVPTQH
ncbi:Protein of unknown function DUF677 [Dillenia turbinata]|uniref:Uncharacterized protein n=1 Tax=Dillenia turbinata TaxID=194707 RepID=A0AAN8W4G3_9MAGN